MRRSLVAVAAVLLAAVCAAPRETIETVDLSRFFTGMDGTFVVWDSATRTTRIHDPDRAATRFLPASTFKIPNSLIALETGVVDGPEFALTRDPGKAPEQPWWPASWRGDHTLRSAIRNSVVWYYQEVARRIGPERMQAWLRRLRYGNEDLSGGIDRFWLDGALRISALEQVDFLNRLLDGRLPVSARSRGIVRDILLLEEAPDYRLYGKTGTASVSATRELGWLVGWVERGERRDVFALNVEGETVWEDWPPHRRADLVRAILRGLDVIPGEAVEESSGAVSR